LKPQHPVIVVRKEVVLIIILLITALGVRREVRDTNLETTGTRVRVVSTTRKGTPVTTPRMVDTRRDITMRVATMENTIREERERREVNMETKKVIRRDTVPRDTTMFIN
jgi:hypothetical protein